jgi:hypothetical protein
VIGARTRQVQVPEIVDLTGLENDKVHAMVTGGV